MLAAVLASRDPLIRRRWSLWARTGLLMGVFDRSNTLNAVQRIKAMHMNSAEGYVSSNTQRTAALAVRAEAILWSNGTPLVYQRLAEFQYDPFIHGMIGFADHVAHGSLFAMRAYSEAELRLWYADPVVRAAIDVKQRDSFGFVRAARRQILSSARVCLELYTLLQPAAELELRRDTDPYSCSHNGIRFDCDIPPDDARCWALMTMLGDPRAARFVWESRERNLDRWCGVVQAIMFNAPIAQNNRAVSDALFERLVTPPSARTRWHSTLWQNYAQAQRGDDVKWMYFDPIRSDFRRQQPAGSTKNAIVDTQQDPPQPDSNLYFQRAFSAAMPLINQHIASRVVGNPQFRPCTHVLLRYELNDHQQNNDITIFKTRLVAQNAHGHVDGALRWFQIHGDGTWFEITDNDDFVQDVDRLGFDRNAFNQFMTRGVPVVAVVAVVRWNAVNANYEGIWDLMDVDLATRRANQLVTEEDAHNWHDPPNRSAFPRVTHSGVFRSYAFAQYEDSAGAPKNVALTSIDRARPLLVMPYIG